MMLNANTLFAGGATLLVVVAVTGGMMLNGSPSQIRLQRLDEQKLNDLRSLAYQIELYETAHDGLPDTLSRLDDTLVGEVTRTTDRETGEEYGYRITGPNSYELCAVFHLASDFASDDTNAPGWTHGAGTQCITVDADANLNELRIYNPY